jgi:hypothetical protein
MKIKFVIISIFLFSGLIETSAQSKFSIGLSSSYLRNYRIITKNSSDLYKDYRNENEGSISGFDIEVNLLYNFKPILFFETGIGYVQKGYKINEDILIDPCYSPITCGYNSELYRYTYDYISVPLHLIFTTSNRLNFSFSIGTSLLIPLSNNVECILRKEFESNTDQKIDIRNNSDPNKFNMSLDLGFGIGFRISEKMNLMILPKFNYNLFSYENTDIKNKIYNISLFINEDKSTKEHLISYGIGIKLLYDLRKSSH